MLAAVEFGLIRRHQPKRSIILGRVTCENEPNRERPNLSVWLEALLIHSLNLSANARLFQEDLADEKTQLRLDELSDKCNEGLLSSEEREEYNIYIQAIDFIGILQSKARKILRRNHS